jgi:hypothetical protein
MSEIQVLVNIQIIIVSLCESIVFFVNGYKKLQEERAKRFI